jgi:hypothetical protein
MWPGCLFRFSTFLLAFLCQLRYARTKTQCFDALIPHMWAVQVLHVMVLCFIPYASLSPLYGKVHNTA